MKIPQNISPSQVFDSQRGEICRRVVPLFLLLKSFFVVEIVIETFSRK